MGSYLNNKKHTNTKIGVSTSAGVTDVPFFSSKGQKLRSPDVKSLQKMTRCHEH